MVYGTEAGKLESIKSAFGMIHSDSQEYVIDMTQKRDGSIIVQNYIRALFEKSTIICLNHASGGFPPGMTKLNIF